MESRDVVAQQADVVVEDAGSGGTALDMDKLTREALVNLLAPFSSGAGASATEIGSVEACQDAWQAAEQLPLAEAATAMEASKAVVAGWRASYRAANTCVEGGRNRSRTGNATRGNSATTGTQLRPPACANATRTATLR